MEKIEKPHSLSVGDLILYQQGNELYAIAIEQNEAGEYIGKNDLYPLLNVDINDCYYIDITSDILNSIPEIKSYPQKKSYSEKELTLYQVEVVSENCFVVEGETPPSPDVVFNIYQDERGFWINQEPLHTLNELQGYYRLKTGRNLNVDIIEVQKVINKS